MLGMLLYLPAFSLADSAGAPAEEMHNLQTEHIMHLVPKGEWLEEGYYIEWTYGKRMGLYILAEKDFIRLTSRLRMTERIL
jgi:hypothetical protein